MDFQNNLYAEVKKLFREGEVDVFVSPPRGPGQDQQQYDFRVRLVHKSTRLEQTCGEYDSQPQNYILAMIRLRVALDAALSST